MILSNKLKMLSSSKIILVLLYLLISCYNQGGYAAIEDYVIEVEPSRYQMRIKNIAITEQMANEIGEYLRETGDCASRPRLAKLIITNTRFPGNTLQIILNDIRGNRTLTELDLQNTAIGDSGAEAVACILQENRATALTTLNLGENAIGDRGAQAIGRALRTNRTLTTLILQNTGSKDEGRNNQIGADGMRAIAKALLINSTLTTLDFGSHFVSGGMNFGIEGAQAVAEVLLTNKTLATLNLVCVNIGGDAGAIAIARALQNNGTLTSLSFSNNNIGVAGAQAIARALQTNRGLIRLSLAGNNIGVEGGIAIAESLRRNSPLIMLNLDGCSVGDKGAQAIAEALQTNTTLISLHLEGVGIETGGALAIAAALRTNSTLTNLYLDFIRPKTEGAQAIVEALAHNNFTLVILDAPYLSKWGGNDKLIKIMNNSLERNRRIGLVEHLYQKYKQQVRSLIAAGSHDRLGALSPMNLMPRELIEQIAVFTNITRADMLSAIMEGAIEHHLTDLTEDDHCLLAEVRGLQEFIIEMLQAAELPLPSAQFLPTRLRLVTNLTIATPQQQQGLPHAIPILQPSSVGQRPTKFRRIS